MEPPGKPVYIHCHVREMASDKLLCSPGSQLRAPLRPRGWDDGVWREGREGGDTCIHIAGSLFCRAETNTAL